MRLAVAVVRQAQARGRPADQVLREELRAARWGAVDAAAAARMVFAWFRWRGRFPSAPEPELMVRTLALAERYARAPGKFSDAALRLAALPEWVEAHFEVSAAWVRTLQQEPLLWLRARPGSAATLAGELGEAEAGLVPGVPDAVRFLGTADLFRSAAFAAGRCEIQDVASQAVGVVCAPLPGETWWDACAGEGGKTLHLADLMDNRGVVWVTDRSSRRLAVLRRRAARAGVFNIRMGDWAIDSPPARRRFDGVLLDAPCSGIGTWQRNPHARWTTTAGDVRELAAIQHRLLAAVARSVRDGGRLVYAVCTMSTLETTAIADAFTAGHPEFEPAPFERPFAHGAMPCAHDMWLPQSTGGNGMFVAKWRRRTA